MTDLELIKTHRMPDGTEYRVALCADAEAQRPEDDGQWPILVVRNVRYSDYVAEAFNKAAEPYVEQFNELFERVRSLRTWERYAKIFLGSQHVHEWGFNRATDASYIAFDTPEWREAVGAPEDISEEDPLAEIKAWLEGDVYGRIAHKRYNPDENLGLDEGWQDFEAGYWVWGFYGRKWAEEEAESLLKDLIASHKEVHRYTEHEKISPHQRDIDSILEFLEGLDHDDMCMAKIFNDGYSRLQRVPESHHQRIVFEHFGIDYKKIEAERELMFKRLSESAQEASNK
jgi:hypothetical protein